MRRTGCWRKRAKWAGVVWCALILAVWGVSLRYSLFVFTGKLIFLHVSSSRLHVYFQKIGHFADFSAEVYEDTFGHSTLGFEWPIIENNRFELRTVWPFWILLAAAAMPTALLFYLDRRKILPGCCKQCGYDLRSISGGRCPECGMAAAADGAS